jgi:tRNA G18 (ribose-2'-O)-methylase SpoU
MNHDMNGSFPKGKVDGHAVREIKRAKWEAKQQKLLLDEETLQARNKWIELNKPRCEYLTLALVQQVKQGRASTKIQQDLLPFFDLKVQDPTLNQLCRDRFIAEGTETVRLLLKQIGNLRPNGIPPVVVLSILVKQGTFFGETSLLQDYEAVHFHLRPQVYIADEQVLSEIAGFPVARGAMACGVPLYLEEARLSSILSNSSKGAKFLALDGISNMANMGSLIRCAAAFGIDALIVSQDCCDAWYRKSVRVSMGNIAKVPIIRIKRDLASVIASLSQQGISSYAAVVDADSGTLVLEDLNKGDVSESWCCVLGNEANGIKKHVIHQCHYKIRIGMVDGVDSLSVSIAAGILLHGLVEKTKRR